MPQFDVRTVTCPKCGNINPYGVTTCLRCGAPLVAALPPPTMPAPYPEPAPMQVPPLPRTVVVQNSLPAPMPQAPMQMNNVPYYGYPVQAPRPPYYAYPVKSRGTALILEILPFFVSILGIGWIYAGNTSAGILWLVGYLMWNGFATVLDIVTFGIFACIHLPMNFVLLLISAISLNNYTHQHPELFGA